MPKITVVGPQKPIQSEFCISYEISTIIAFSPFINSPEIDFEDQYDKAAPIDGADLDASMNRSIREQDELEGRIARAEWTSTNKDDRTKLELIVFNKKKQEKYIMRALKTIISILHRGFEKIK